MSFKRPAALEPSDQTQLRKTLAPRYFASSFIFPPKEAEAKADVEVSTVRAFRQTPADKQTLDHGRLGRWKLPTHGSLRTHSLKSSHLNTYFHLRKRDFGLVASSTTGRPVKELTRCSIISRLILGRSYFQYLRGAQCRRETYVTWKGESSARQHIIASALASNTSSLCSVCSNIC